MADDPSINLLETRAARESVMALSEPGDRVRLHIDNRTAAAYIRCQGGTRSNVLSQEALLLWEQAVSRDVTLLPPQWIPTGENTAADFLSRHNMAQWMSMLDRKVFRSILDHFRKETNQVDPVLGGCCRRHGPYIVGPSSATTLKRVL